jgi:predicted nucleic acid-binding protein
LIVIDSSGWLEFLSNGPNADRYARHLRRPDQIVTPTIVLYEVYKHVKRLTDEERAIEAVGLLYKTLIVPLDDEMALLAADASLEHRLPMADAIVFATAQRHDAILVTSDSDFEELPGVTYIPKKMRRKGD